MYRRGRGSIIVIMIITIMKVIRPLKERERALHALKVRLDYPKGDKSEAGQHRGSQSELPGVVGLGQLQSSHVSAKRIKL